MKAAVLFLSSLALLPDALGDDAKPRSGRLPATCEVVMSPGNQKRDRGTSQKRDRFDFRRLSRPASKDR
jgi:hypothetical protein